MAIYRAQLGFAMDSALPRDVITINPHYSGDNPQALADALKANLLANTLVGATKTFTVKVYDAQKAPPSYPLAIASNGTTFTVTSQPRELALCLSYYSTWNRPTYRGRMFIPMSIIGGGMGLRPTTTQRTDAGAWATTLGKGLPAQHVWCVFSHKRNAADAVTDWWVDDEWDVVRSRGLRGTVRLTGKLP